MSNPTPKPKHFLVLKIIGFVLIVVAIIGIVLTAKGCGDFESNNFLIGAIMTSFGFFGGFACLMIGFRPELTKLTTSSTKYIQQENKQNLTDIANTSAKIAENAITKTANAFKKGLENEKMFCKHCGASIDADSRFCSVCGKEQ